MENFSIYLSYKLTSSNLVKELHEYKLKKLCDVRVFSIVLRTTSKDLPFPSLLLFKKISSKVTDAVKCAQNAGKKSENVCLWKNFETPSFKHVNFQKNYFSMPSLSEDNRELSVHIEKNRETSSWLLSWTFGGWFSHQLSTAFQYMETSRRRELTASFLDFANYSCQNFAI